MDIIGAGHQATVYPFAAWGYTNSFLSINLHTVYHTWVVLGIIGILVVLGRWALHRPHSLAYAAYDLYCKQLLDLVEKATHRHIQRYFFLITALFTFILLCNWLMLIGVEEPTTDYNTTLALALCTFWYTQKEALKAHGLLGYLGEYCKTPLSLGQPTLLGFPVFVSKVLINTVITLALLPLELMSKCSSILSMSFRLFGNIIAGSIIYGLWKKVIAGSLVAQCIGLLGVNMVLLAFFGIFEGAVQAFVFTMLAMTYLALAVSHQRTEVA